MSSLSQEENKQRMELLRAALPDCQPQEGSPANTFTTSELEELKKKMREMNIGPRDKQFDTVVANANKLDVFNSLQWSQPSPSQENSQGGDDGDSEHADTLHVPNVLNEETWFGSPEIPSGLETQAFREEVRMGLFTKPTNAKCPGYLQCNLVVLPQGQVAFDFLLFCQRNKKACPLIEVCYGHPSPNGVAKGADLRTDVPKYAIYENGELKAEVTDATDYWPENAVSFLIGCSFTYDGALLKAGIPLRSAELGKNVPMYKTNLKCRSSGSLHGNMVVSMKPIKALDVAKEVEITSQFPHAHGGPVCVGNAKAIGIQDINNPEWGDSIDVRDDEVPVFHACGVTPQSVLMESRVPFAITHSAGHMFMTDLPSDTSF